MKSMSASEITLAANSLRKFLQKMENFLLSNLEKWLITYCELFVRVLET